MKSVAKKIQALLAKTVENGASPMEAESALAKANELMTTYYINLNDVKNLAIQERVVTNTVPMVFRKTKITAVLPTLTNLFECNWYARGNESYSIVGFESDVEIAEYLLTFIHNDLSNKIEVLKKSDLYKQESVHTHGYTIVSNYIKGYARGIAQNLRQLFQDRKDKLKDYSNSQALVLTKKKEVDEYFSTLGVKLVTRHTTVNNAGMFNRGKQDGIDTNIRKAVHGSRQAAIA